MDLAEVVAWMVDGARTQNQPQTVFGEICDRLVAAGVPLYRGTIFVRTLHPELVGRRFRWRRGRGVEIMEAPLDELEADGYLDNPIHSTMESGEPLRLDLAEQAPQYPILRELAGEGVTDYLAQPLPFTDGTVQGVSWMTQRPAGFTEADLASLETIRTPLARLAEVYALRRTAINLLNTYVGHGAGERILRGAIRRGDTETIHAALLFSDLRGFTPLSDTIDGARLIELLNKYFDCLVPPIEACGGEVLKFVGDAVLAIFPIGRKEEERAARCAQALEAAQEAVARLHERNTTAQQALRCGIALHVGDVLYGNIGSSGRLDFTAIGPAVNLASRLDNVARDLGREIVTSAQFAEACGARLEFLQHVELRGFREPQPVFGVEESR